MTAAPAAPNAGAANITRAAAPLVLLSLAAATLLYIPPADHSFYPQCPVYIHLHLLCPGCGTTRALAALLRGHVAEAMRLNALTTLLFPIAAAYAIPCYMRFLKRAPLYLPPLPAAAIYSALFIAAAFTLVRNLSL